MTTSTPNLSLVLYNSSTDQSATFATFRADIAGTSSTSNFYKIDTAWGDLDTRIDSLETIRSGIPISASYISANYYEATSAILTAYATGMSIVVTLDTDSAGTVTLRINALATVSLMKVDSTGTPVNFSAGELQAGRRYSFIYDGTRWLWVNATSADQVYHSGTSGNIVLVDANVGINSSGTPLAVVGGAISGASTKSSIVDADSLGLIDSEDSSTLKEITWATIKANIPSAPSNRSWFGV